MKTLKKSLLLSSAIALLAAGCNSQSAPAPAPSPTPQVQVQTQNAPAANPTPQAKPQPQNPAPAPAPSPAPSTPPAKPLTVYENVQGSTINKASYSVDVGVNAFDLLKATHVVGAKDYGSSMGMFVQTIDGIAPDSTHFWKFFVNGKSSNVGASSYTLKNGDKIEWKLDLISGSN